jgi:hypothetical protein
LALRLFYLVLLLVLLELLLVLVVLDSSLLKEWG